MIKSLFRQLFCRCIEQKAIQFSIMYEVSCYFTEICAKIQNKILTVFSILYHSIHEKFKFKLSTVFRENQIWKSITIVFDGLFVIGFFTHFGHR